MTERQWEMYRLNTIEATPDSAYKRAVIDGIKHKLKVIDLLEQSGQAYVQANEAASGR